MTFSLSPMPQALSVAIIAFALAGCNEQAAQNMAPVYVETTVARFSDYAPVIVITGEIRARAEADMSFRVGGRVMERLVDVGDHVAAGQVLARIDPQEQVADLAAAQASVSAAEAKLVQASAAFDRQKELLKQGFTTQREFDSAQEGLRTAQGQLDGARAQRLTAGDAISFTELRSSAAGIITQRSVEVGQYAQAAQPAFKLAQDGARDAVFNINESGLVGSQPDDQGAIQLISDPTIRAAGRLREMAPTVDTASGTVRIKVGILDTPPEMKLGMAVIGTARYAGTQVIALPAAAITSMNSKPAVWVLGADGATVNQREVTVLAYDTANVYLSDGVKPGETIVAKGIKLLRAGLKVKLSEGRAS